MFPLHCIPKILYTESIDAELITVQKVFLYDPMLIHKGLHPLQTDRRVTDRDRQQCGTIDAYSIAVIKTPHQKLCTV